jgi:hypothetical protein
MKGEEKNIMIAPVEPVEPVEPVKPVEPVAELYFLWVFGANGVGEGLLKASSFGGTKLPGLCGA